MNIRTFLFLCLLPAGISIYADDVAPPADLPVVILLGDSIRMNYQASVTKSLSGKVVVRAPKDNCSHTAYMLENIERWLKGVKPDVIHINVGLHDLYLDSKTDKPRHSLKTYDKNLRAILAKLKHLTDAKIIFALTTVVNEKNQAISKGYGRVVRRNSDIEIYNARALKVAGEMGITVNNLNAFMKKIGPEKILRASDGIHLSPEGADLMGTEVAAMILRHLSE